MRNRALYLAALLALVAAGPARAQEGGGFGLDLSGDTTSESTSTEEQEEGGSEEAVSTEGLGLEVSTGTDTALLPRFVLLGLSATSRIGAPAWRQWVATLRAVGTRSGRVAPGADPQEAMQALESNYQGALQCTEAECLREPAETLDADLLTVARLEKEGRGWRLRLWTYDRDSAQVELDEVTGRAPRDKRFLRQGAVALAQRLAAMARPRSLLKVRSSTPQAVVRVGERVLGVGNVEVRLPPGPVSLTVEAEGFDAFNRSLELAPGEALEVEALLMASGPAPEGPPEEVERVPRVQQRAAASSGPGLFSRPGLYTALVGLVAAGVGVALSQSANSVLSRTQDADGDGVLDVTRRDYLQARDQATLSTALIAGGGAVVGASVLWVVLVPASTPAAPSPAPAQAARGGVALHLALGGSF